MSVRHMVVGIQSMFGRCVVGIQSMFVMSTQSISVKCMNKEFIKHEV